MPMLATILLGVAGNAAWKLATYLYDRFTAPSPSSVAGASAPGSFARSLAEVTGPRAAMAPAATAAAATPGAARLPQASNFTGADPGSIGPAATPEMASITSAYHRMAEVQAP